MSIRSATPASIPFLLVLAGAAGCAPLLQQRVQAPGFEIVADRPAELRVLPPSVDRPFGALTVRMWARVTNPNPFGMTIVRLWGDLLLDEIRAAEVDFPLGIPLAAGQDAVVPFDVVVDPRDVPGIAPVVTRAIRGDSIEYHLVGRVRVDAGVLGQPTFGPMTILSGSVQPVR